MPAGVLPPGTLFYRVFHDSPVGMVITTVDEGRYVEVNDAFLRLVGCSREELADQTFTMVGLHNQEERELVLNVLRRVERLGNIPFMLTTRANGQRPCIASIQGEEIEGETYFIIIIQDLAEQEAAQVALQVSEDRFRLLFQTIPLPLLVVDDLTRQILDVNTAACNLYGYTAGEFAALTMLDLLPADDRERVGGGSPIDTAALRRQQLKDESVIEVDVSSYSFELAGRRVSLAIVQDVTEQRAAQEALQASEARLQIVADVTTDAIWIRDMLTDEVEWSTGLDSQFGYADDADRPHTWWLDHVHPEDRARVDESVAAVMAGDEKYWTAEYRFLRADGAYANVLDRAYIARDGDGRPVRFIGAMVDITAQLHVAEAASRAAQEERQRLARDLHESVTQSLYSLSLLAEAARRRASAGEHQATAEFIGRLGDLSRQALRQLRLLLYELRPAVLEQEGLAGALRHRLEAVERRAGVQVALIDELDTPLPAALQSELFLLGLETLNYSLKHAAASSVKVILRGDGNEIILEAVDNGSGYKGATEADGDLQAIRRRAQGLGGVLEVEAASERGETIRARVPIGSPAEQPR